MTSFFKALSLGVLLLAGPAFAQTGGGGSGSGAGSGEGIGTNTGRAGAAQRERSENGDETFVEKAAISGMLEIELGKIAQEKATNPNIRDFGKKMVEDHAKANADLKKAAAAANIEVPAGLGSKERKAVDRMKKMEGAKFDNAYVEHQAKDHKKAVEMFEKQAKSGGNPELSKFAADTLPVLQEHAQLVKVMDGQISSRSGSRRN